MVISGLANDNKLNSSNNVYNAKGGVDVSKKYQKAFFINSITSNRKIIYASLNSSGLMTGTTTEITTNQPIYDGMAVDDDLNILYTQASLNIRYISLNSSTGVPIGTNISSVNITGNPRFYGLAYNDLDKKLYGIMFLNSKHTLVEILRDSSGVPTGSVTSIYDFGANNIRGLSIAGGYVYVLSSTNDNIERYKLYDSHLIGIATSAVSANSTTTLTNKGRIDNLTGLTKGGVYKKGTRIGYALSTTSMVV